MSGLMKAIPRFVSTLFKAPKIIARAINRPKVNTYPFLPRKRLGKPRAGKHLIGKRVKVVSHCGPEFRGRTGIITNIRWGNRVGIEFDDNKYERYGSFSILGVVNYNPKKQAA